jgi:hypothetical protein
MESPSSRIRSPSHALATTGIGVLIGLALSGTFQARARPHSAPDVLDVGTLRAGRIELVGGSGGKPLATLAAGYDGGHDLQFTDKNGKPRIHIGVSKSGTAFVRLQDRYGQVRASLEVGDEGPAQLTFRNHKGDAHTEWIGP